MRRSKIGKQGNKTEMTLFLSDAIFQARPHARKPEKGFTSLICRWLGRFIPNDGEGLLFAV